MIRNMNCLTKFLQSSTPRPLILGFLAPKSLSTTSPVSYPLGDEPKNWPMLNKVIYPPMDVEGKDKAKPAFICHYKPTIKYSPLKMWYVACLVRGMSIDEALRQLDYVKKKGGPHVKECLLEAQEMAVQQHNVEFRSNLWVAESNVTYAGCIKGIRRHAKSKIGQIKYKYVHYFCRLEEGSPPPNFYRQVKFDGPTHLERWIQERRDLRIHATY